MPVRSALPARRLLPAIACVLLLVLGGSPAAARPCTPNATTPRNDTSANGTSLVVLANATAGSNASNATVVVEGGGTVEMSDQEKADAKAKALKEKADAAAAASAAAAAKAAIVTDPVSAKMVRILHP